MEGINIEQYGDLTDKEFVEFLSEIEDDNEEIEEAEIEAAKNIAIEENISGESPENIEIEALYGEDAWRKLNKNNIYLHNHERQKLLSQAAVKAIKQKASRLKEDRIRVQKEAFNQENIRLTDAIGKDNMKTLITLLTQEHTRLISKYEAFINKRLTVLLNPYIPKKLRLCKSLYPQAVPTSPGFLYKASEDFGKGYTFWANPYIPIYFTQGTEQKILMDRKPVFLIAIDKAVLAHHEHKEKRAKKELKYASTLMQKGIFSFFDLLKLNPFWFEILYNNLTDKNNG